MNHEASVNCFFLMLLFFTAADSGVTSALSHMAPAVPHAAGNTWFSKEQN